MRHVSGLITTTGQTCQEGVLVFDETAVPTAGFMTRHPVNLCDDVNESQSSFFVDLCVPASDLATQIIWERNESTQVELTKILFDV